MNTPERIVIAGNGMAGARLAAALSEGDTAGRLRVTVLGAEPAPAYHRVLLGDVVTGALDAADIAMPTHPGTDVRPGVSVTAVDPGRQFVHCGAETVPYDALVLATGAAPVIPPLTGLPEGGVGAVSGVHVMRTLADCEALRAALPDATHVVVVGGGPLGIETASGVAGRGLRTTLVHSGERLLSAVTDDTAASALRRTIRERGVTVETGSPVTGLHLDGSAVAGVQLGDGRDIAADLVILACGVRPAASLARSARIALGRHGGIAVDDELRTSQPHVYAIGDCAEHRGHRGDQVATAWAQAAVLADRLTGRAPSARYRGVPRTLRLRANLGVAAIGDCVTAPAPAGDPASQVVELVDARRASYRKAVISGTRLTGALLVGDLAAVGTLTDYHARGIAVPAQPLDLFRLPQPRDRAVR